MTLTRSQLDQYDARPLSEIAACFKRLCPRLESLFQNYVATVTDPSWQGVAADAAHARAVADRKTGFALADTVEKSANRLEQGFWDVDTPLRSARSVIAGAEAAGFTVTQDLTVANAPGSAPSPETERARGDWQQQLTHAVNEVTAQDGRLQQELSTLRASMQATFDAVARSQTSVDETRFADSEQYIFEEMKRNINSDVVKDIHELLREPQWYEFGRNYGGDIQAALVMWGLKVAPNQDWDHKPKLTQRFGLRKKDDFYFRQPGTDRKVFYDIYSNMHYGYVGRAAGFDADTLIKGASLGESALTGKDDEGDQITMRAGIELYDKYGPNLTEPQFHQAMIDTIDKMEQAKEDGKNVPQIEHGN